jgi:hypothetical protein
MEQARTPARQRRSAFGVAIVALGAALGLLGILADGRLDAAHLVPLAVIAVVVALTLAKTLRGKPRR